MPKRFVFLAAALTATLGLAACQTPGQATTGMSEAQALSSLGRPTARIALPDGSTRLQYSGQPSQQSVWNLDFDAAGKLVRREQMMTDSAFAQIRTGKATQVEILRDFGPPADIQSYPLKQETSYMYRYYTFGGFPAAFFISFDPAGTVVGTQTGLDPYMLGGTDRK